MKSGFDWQVRGIGREARETAREAARRSGMSVGEWLDTVITDSAEAEPQRPDEDEHRLPPKHRVHADDDNSYRPARSAPPAPDTGLADVNDRLDNLARQLDKLARLNAAPAPSPRATARDDINARTTARDDAGPRPTAREDIGPRPTARDDAGARQFASTIANLSERIEQLSASVGTHAAATERPRPAPPPAPPPPATTPLDQAMLEIADRQRALDGYPAAPAVSVPPAAPPATLPRARTQEFQGLEQQLRQINAQIETLNRPCAVDTLVQKAVDTLRDDLAEIGALLHEAMPRKAVEALEGEMRNLAERIDQTRQTGADADALGGLERGLAEVRDALRSLTPAESLADLEATVRGLERKIDSLSLNQQDPAALKQLEGAILAMRGIVSHVASSDALASLSEEVRALAAKVDNATSDNDVLSTLDQRIAMLADALEARNQGGETIPHELAMVVNGLGDKIERLQLSRDDDRSALGPLEERIVMLVEKLDASDARLNQLEAIERGLAELLIHIEHNRVPQLTQAAEAKQPPARVEAIQRDLANLQHIERKTQDSLEAVQSTLGDVVDRLAMIETDMRGKTEDAVIATAKAVIASATAKPARASAESWHTGLDAGDANTPTVPVLPTAPTLSAAGSAPAPEPIERAHTAPQSRAASPVSGERRVIDPNLPPDHPLEPGSAPSRGRAGGSPADRIAASEAALGSNKPPVIADPGGKSNFIAAARRAAQTAAAAETPARHGAQPTESSAPTTSLAGKVVDLVRDHTRTVIVALSVMVIVLGSLNMVWNWLGGSDEPETAAPSKSTSSVPVQESQAAPPAAPTPPAGTVEAPSTPATPPPGRQSSLFPTPAVAPFGTGSIIGEAPRQQTSAIAAAPEVTGTISAPARSAPAHAPAVAAPVPAAAPAPVPTHTAAIPPAAATSAAPATSVDKLPHAFNAELRAAAAKGDPAAQFEIALRYVEGRGVPQNLTEAAEWLDRAAKQGLVPAQFRLGGLYEKGLGVKKNAETARRYYTMAGEAGNAKALHNLAVLYAEGIDGKPDYQTASLWFRKAAAHGVSDSQYNLGILYARGIGVEQNLAEAYRWFALAAHSGDPESAKKRDDVAARLDPQSLQMAQQAVDAFKAEPQPEAAVQVRSPAGGWDSSPHPVSIVIPVSKRKQPAAAVAPRLDLTTPPQAR